MRTTNAQTLAIARQAMDSNFQRIARTQVQTATGQKHLLPSDDPVATLRMLRLSSEQTALEQHQKNITVVSVGLKAQEHSLTSTSDAFKEMRTHLLWAKNGANSPKDLAAMAGPLQSLERMAFDYANAREDGSYLLSGTASDKPALSFDANATPPYSVTGNDQHRSVPVGDGMLVDGNVTASSVYGSGVELLNALHALNAQLNAPTAAVSAALDDVLGKLDSTHDRLLGSLTELGARQNTLQLLADHHANISTLNSHTLEALGSFDLADGRLKMDNYLMATQFSLSAWKSISALSLFDQM